MLPVTHWLVRLDAGPADRLGQQPAHGEGVVAHHLRVEPPATLPREPFVERIGGQSFRGGDGGLAIRAAGDEQLHRALDIPAVIHEIGRQPVEQLRVRGRRTLCTEVVQRHGKPAPEAQRPQPVDHHAGGERVIF